ncbi:uncharacterized protein LOC130915989 [Corythoichthys intestinalis]|uniref:uncharacterized protein LOC130915989 n=1 Tax=Corythoichthys intestinalis TaxID=161448 RepID=UPI0025A687FB|nr:uncharacterized protein LOC130915989 [Corythoichthys intestinalis]
MPEMASIDITDCCDVDVREAVELLKGSTELTADQKRSIQSVTTGWDLPVATEENRRWLTEKILFHAVLSRSKTQIKQLRKGLKATGVLDLVTQRPDTMQLLFPRSCAELHSPQLLLERIIWPAESDSDDDTDDPSLDEKCRITGYLRKYIENASSQCLQELLKFWHGWEVPPNNLYVEVVRGQMPQSSTCMETLRLPSHYTKYEDFCEALNAACFS